MEHRLLGRSDPGETSPITALREAHEEVGLAPDYVTLAGLSSPYRTGTGFLVTPVVGFIQPGFSLSPNPAEVADIFETPFGVLMDPANHRRHAYEWNGEVREWYSMPYRDGGLERFIWGATAGMLRNFYHLLRA